MEDTSSQWPMTNTQHGILVAFGEYLTQQGLIERLMQVPVKQKTRDYRPQSKLVEFLAGIMSGIEYLQDLNHGPHALTKDAAVARAWGQTGFAHYSGVSRTLEACDEETVAAVEGVISEFSRPFITSSIDKLLRSGQVIIYDLDLTGQSVSSTSQGYPEAAFGWMDDGVKLGYQLARVCMQSEQGERIWLAGFHHPGDTISASCLKELMLAAEAQTGIRPRRRTEWVEKRIQAQNRVVVRRQELIRRQQEKQERLQQRRKRLIGMIFHAKQQLKSANSAPQAARLQVQSAGWEKRLPQTETELVRCQQVLLKHEAQLTKQEHNLEALQAWKAQLETDNLSNPDPPLVIEARMDAGFASSENLTWLLEMGYSINTKALNNRVTAALRARISPQTHWLRVGDNAEMTAWGDYHLHGCPFPLTVALERFKVKGKYKYATLILYRDNGLYPTLPVWFEQYNARQTIEAGNKELKGTFFVQHLMSRSLAGIRIQVLFTGLAANTVRWCQPWLQTCTAIPSPHWLRTLTSPKHLIRVAANTTALVQRSRSSLSLQFAPDSPFPGVTLLLNGVPAFQLVLGFNRPLRIETG